MVKRLCTPGQPIDARMLPLLDLALAEARQQLGLAVLTTHMTGAILSEYRTSRKQPSGQAYDDELERFRADLRVSGKVGTVAYPSPLLCAQAAWHCAPGPICLTRALASTHMHAQMTACMGVTIPSGPTTQRAVAHNFQAIPAAPIRVHAGGLLWQLVPARRATACVRHLCMGRALRHPGGPASQGGHVQDSGAGLTAQRAAYILNQKTPCEPVSHVASVPWLDGRPVSASKHAATTVGAPQ